MAISTKGMAGMIDEYIGSLPESLELDEAARNVMNALVESLHASADHVRSDWQDERLAREIEKLAGKVDRVIPDISY